jgi:hypothetical protein
MSIVSAAICVLLFLCVLRGKALIWIPAQVWMTNLSVSSVLSVADLLLLSFASFATFAVLALNRRSSAFIGG